jgi:Flp pilus assembly protein TadD
MADGQETSALDELKAALERDPGQSTPHMLLGMLLESKGDAERAEKHYRSALEADPKLAPAANNLAYLLADQNRELNEALDLAQRAKHSDPEDPVISDTLGFVYYKKGLFDYAIEELTAASEALPDNAVVRYHLGMAYYKKGDRDRAAQELEKALSLDGSFKGADLAKQTLAELQ